MRENIIDWMVDWCWTFDPRNPVLGLPGLIPWIPWPRQVEFIEWFYDRYLNQKSGLVEKSRDAGATWLFCLVFLREWRWEEGFAGGIGSRKLTLVDDKENPKAIFVKLRTLFNNQPDWWYPKKWNDKCDKIANLINPENGSNIAGEGGDDIGRGDRRSCYLVDEAAFLEHPGMVDSALSQTTNSQFDLSTPNGMNHFGQKRHSGKVEVFTFHWKQDDRKTEDWYEEQCSTLDDVIVAQEIDIDYHASVEGLFIPPEHVKAAIELDLPSVGTKSAGLDVAAGGANKSSLAIRCGPNVQVMSRNYKNGSDLVHWAIDECNRAGISYLNYDKIGVGHSVYSTIERTEREIRFEKYGVNAGGRASDVLYPEYNKRGNEIFVNPRAEWWHIAATRFRKTHEYVTAGIKHPFDELISIPNNGELIAQLSSPKKMVTETGKIKVESKDSMLSRGIRSPDEADALIMSVIPQNAGIYNVWPSFNKKHVKRFVIDWKKVDPVKVKVYGVLYADKDYSISGNFFFWNKETRALKVYSELIHPNPIADSLSLDIMRKCQLTLKANSPFQVAVDTIYGNDLMFSQGKDDIMLKLRKQGIRIKQNLQFNEAGSVIQANKMFKNNQILVNSDLEETDRQYRTWSIENQRPVKGFPLCRSLCIIINVLREQGAFKKELILKPYGAKKEKIRKDLERIHPGTTPQIGKKNIADFDDYLAK